MEQRDTSERAQSAPRYAAGDARNAGRSNRSTPPSGGPSSGSMPRPRVRVRRMPPPTSGRFDVPAMYEREDESMVPELAFDDDFQLDDELKMEFDRSMRAHRRPQRIKYVKCKTRVLPDLLVPYLYAGDRRSRMNAIMDRTGCTIDYCPESPDDSLDMLQPQRSGNHYLMCFLVAAETTGQLETAARLLHVLVDRVQAHVELKLGAAGERGDGDINTTPRHDTSELSSPQVRLLRHSDIDYAHLSAMDSDRLKTQTDGGTEDTTMDYECAGEPIRSTVPHASTPETAQQREARWTYARGAADSHSWHEQAQMHTSQSRRRQLGTKFRRPVYRRVLVDEDGYEVYERPQFDHLQHYSPRLPGHMTSPPLRRRGAHEPVYHRDSSSDEDTRLRSGTTVPVRSSRTVSQLSNAVHEAAAPRVVMYGDGDVHELASRRGLKRRLDLYEPENVFTRRRTVRSGGILYDYMGDDFEAEYALSGDEFVGDIHREVSSPHPFDPLSEETSSTPGHNNQQAGGLSGLKRRGDVAGSRADTGDQDRVADERKDYVTRDEGTRISGAQIDQSSGRSMDCTNNQLSFNGATTSAGGDALSSSSESSPSKDPVSASVSIAFDAVADSAALASDTESVAEIAIAPSMLATAISVSEAPSDKQRCNESEGTLRGEPAIAAVSVTQGASPVQLRACSFDEDNHSQNKPDNHDPGKSPRVEDPSDSTLMRARVMKSAFPTARRALNDAMMGRLSSDSHLYTASNRVHSRLNAVARRLADLIDEARSHAQLQDLAHAAHKVESELWRLETISLEEKQAPFSSLETAISYASDPKNAVGDRVSALHNGLRDVVSSSLLQTTDDETSRQEEAPRPQREANCGKTTDSLPSNDAHIDDQVNCGGEAGKVPAPRSLEHVLKSNHDQPAPNNRAPRLNIPAEAPKFVSGLVTELERTTGLSTVMFSGQKRLLREISKSDPYYYLHPMVLLESTRKGRGSTCAFGCAGASAHKWERKVVSQISSRMKWFDSVAYSLAKVSGGKELLSRKKMNSTIRKLHLVALQLHCLIAHLFCIRKRVVCREVDSLPTALNNSYYEKRMNGYKSRLKLTLHQQPLPASAANSLPAEELVRDTFEFYPELLLLIDIWGYDYRQDSDPVSKLPLDLLRTTARQAFDFESDTNGLLQGICEELLGILCLWNDFKWGESLESLNTDDIIEFEAKVKSSIRKILETHASHLLSQWSSQLAKSPAILNHLRLTQSNVYYSEQPMSGGSTSSVSLASQRNLLREEEEEDEDEEDHRDEEDKMLQDFWRTRFTSSTTVDGTPKDCAAAGVSFTPLNLSPLHEEFVLSTAQTREKNPSLSWSEVYDMRQRCNLLAGNAENLLIDVSNARDGTEETISADVLNLLSRIVQARTIVEDAIRTSEKLALHSVHEQRDEPENSHRDAIAGAGSLADVESMSDESRDEDDAIVDALLSGSDVNVQKDEVSEEQNIPKDEDAWKQPVLKDLVEIVTSTNQEMSEICGQRARSARVRDKLQSQSLELARQSIQIFQTILNMKP